MLRVFKASGEEVLALQLAAFGETIGAGEQATRIFDLKHYLQSVCGQPRFRQRLLLPDGQILPDDAVLDGPTDVQLILLPFCPSSRDQVERLCDAADENDLPTLEQLLQRPQDPNLEYYGSTPLQGAAFCGSVDAVRLLLEACADKDWASTTGRTPLYEASLNGHADVVRVLLEAKADKDKANNLGATATSVASKNGHAEVVRILTNGTNKYR